MATAAVNPVLQQSVLDKFAKPIADKSKAVVENLDLTVEKQSVVVEKQDEIGTKIKQVVADIDSSRIKDSFAKSSDGIKELTFGLLDIKGIMEQVAKKFQALQDVFAPIAEIGSFGLHLEDRITGQKALKEKGDEITMRYRGKDGRRRERGTDKDGKKFDRFAKAPLGFLDKFKLMIGTVTKMLGNLVKAMIPLMLKFVFFGGIFALAAFAIGKFVEYMGGWDWLEDTINDLELNFMKLGQSISKFRKNFMTFDPTKRKQLANEIAENERIIQFKEDRNEDKARVRELKKEFTSEGGVLDEVGFKKATSDEGLITGDVVMDDIGRYIDSVTGNTVGYETTADKMQMDLKRSPGFNPFTLDFWFKSMSATDILQRKDQIKKQREREREFLIESGEITDAGDGVYLDQKGNKFDAMGVPIRNDGLKVETSTGEKIEVSEEDLKDITKYMFETLSRDLSPPSTTTSGSVGGSTVVAPQAINNVSTNLVGNQLPTTSETIQDNR